MNQPHARGLTIHFIDGKSMSVSFPAQTEDQYLRKLLVGEILKNRTLIIESDGAVHFIPFENIRQMTVYPAPKQSIPGVITGARISP
jgi:hypothetical protein